MIDIDIIGPLFADEGGQLPGWHVNTTPESVATVPALALFLITPEPSRLRRVWAGDDPLDPKLTVALRFVDEVAALAVLPDPHALT